MSYALPSRGRTPRHGDGHTPRARSTRAAARTASALDMNVDFGLWTVSAGAQLPGHDNGVRLNASNRTWAPQPDLHLH